MPFSPPASPPDSEEKKPDLKRQRSVSFNPVEAKIQVYKQNLEKVAISEVVQQVKSARQLRRCLAALSVTGLVNIYLPQGILAIGAAMLIRSINESDLRPERNLKVSLAELQGRKDGLKRVKRKLGVARTFCILADLFSILLGGVTGISGTIAAVLPGEVFPTYISFSLIGVAVCSLSLVATSTLTSILADRQLFLISFNFLHKQI